MNQQQDGWKTWTRGIVLCFHRRCGGRPQPGSSKVGAPRRILMVRLNLHLLDLIQQEGGLILVDATRRGIRGADSGPSASTGKEQSGD